MTVIETIYQCGRCNRMHDGARTIIPFRACVPEIRDCGLEDCQATANASADRDRRKAQARRQRRLERETRPVASENNPGPRAATLPYHDPDLTDRQVLGPDASTPETKLPAGMETARTMGQEQFVASGAANSQNEKIWEFFVGADGLVKAHNFNQWFKSTFLEELSGATRMNNRAIDLRPRFEQHGFYLDNCMMRDGHTDRMGSYYRVCRIEDALSLTAAEKFKKIHGYEMPPEGQKEFKN